MDVNIRLLEERDAYTSVAWRNNPQLWRYTGSAPDREITIEDELAWIKKVMADPTSRRYAILADGVYIGNIYMTDMNSEQAEYHIFIGEQDYQGKGIAKQASLLLIDVAKSLRLKRLILEVEAENIGAVKLYQKLGFKESVQIGSKLHMMLQLTGDENVIPEAQ